MFPELYFAGFRSPASKNLTTFKVREVELAFHKYRGPGRNFRLTVYKPSALVMMSLIFVKTESRLELSYCRFYERKVHAQGYFWQARAQKDVLVPPRPSPFLARKRSSWI